MVISGCATCDCAMIYNALEYIPDIKYYYILPFDYFSFPEQVDQMALATFSGAYDYIIVLYSNVERTMVWNVEKYDNRLDDYLEKNYQLLIQSDEVPLEMWQHNDYFNSEL